MLIKVMLAEVWGSVGSLDKSPTPAARKHTDTDSCNRRQRFEFALWDAREYAQVGSYECHRYEFHVNTAMCQYRQAGYIR